VGGREGWRKPSSSVLLRGKVAWESEANTICRTGDKGRTYIYEIKGNNGIVKIDR
jgi:hypothetical protein